MKVTYLLFQYVNTWPWIAFTAFHSKASASQMFDFPLNQKILNYVSFQWKLNQNPHESAFLLKRAHIFILHWIKSREILPYNLKLPSSKIKSLWFNEYSRLIILQYPFGMKWKAAFSDFQAISPSSQITRGKSKAIINMSDLSLTSWDNVEFHFLLFQ